MTLKEDVRDGTQMSRAECVELLDHWQKKYRALRERLEALAEDLETMPRKFTCEHECEDSFARRLRELLKGGGT